eukprot:14923560-Ditylum_brightwellii.AAC.1
MYKRGQQVLVNIDVNNSSGWGYRHTTNMQWIKALVAGWECHCTFNISKVKLLEGDEAGSI